MQEKASIINALIKSSSNGYHLGGLTSFLGVHVLYSLLLLYRHKVPPHLEETLFVDSPKYLGSFNTCMFNDEIILNFFHFYK
jgi:hypothetical protein